MNGKLIHSKKTQGHGFLHTNAAQQKVVFDAIGVLYSPSFCLYCVFHR